MKNLRVLFLSLSLLFACIVSSEAVDTRVIIKLIKQSAGSNLKSLPVSGISLQCYLNDNSIELTAEGGDVSFDVQIVNTSTNEIVFDGSVECIDGVSTYIPNTFEEGSYYISVSTSSAIWEGAFDIY